MKHLFLSKPETISAKTSKVSKLLLICLLFVFGFAVQTASAQGSSANANFPGAYSPGVFGDGSAGYPFQINSVAELATLATLVNANNASYIAKYYKLMNNLDLNVTPHNSGTGWTPIGTWGNPFKGTFDGNGKTVSNLFINASGSEKGLFGSIESGVVKDLAVTGSVKAGPTIGGFTGALRFSRVENCSFTGTVEGNEKTGGIAGFVETLGSTTRTTITNCYFEGDVKGYGQTGGLLGINIAGDITNCYAKGTVTVAGNGSLGVGDRNVGGLIGRSEDGVPGTPVYIKNCYFQGTITATNAGGTGGLIGKTWRNDISACYVIGTINGVDVVGGLVGEVSLDNIVKDCFFSGDVAGTSGHVGGLVGWFNSPCSLSNCYTTGTVKGNDNVGGIIGNLAGGTIKNCAALTSNIRKLAAGNSAYGRVTGNGSTTLTDNYAWDGMTATYGTGSGTTTSTWANIGTNARDGYSVSKTLINEMAGGFFQNVFANDKTAWTFANYKLAGLKGVALTMPVYLKFWEVTFDTDGGSPSVIASQYINPDNATARVTKPANPTKEGFIFAGWFEGVHEWNFANDIVPGDITLTAQWEEPKTLVIEHDEEVTMSQLEYNAGGYGDIIIKSTDSSTGQLIIDGTLTVNGLVKFQKTFTSSQWYPIGFPFDIAQVYCDDCKEDEYGKDGDEGFLDAYNGSVGDFWLKACPNDGGKFEYKTSFVAGDGYVIQFSTYYEGMEIAFISTANPVLSNDTPFESLTAAYLMKANPSVANRELIDGTGNLHFYLFDRTDAFLHSEGKTDILKPFEALVVIEQAGTVGLKTISIENGLTDLGKINTGNDKIVEVRYYNLQGMKIAQPEENAFCIVKTIYESSKVEVSKKIYKN